MNTVLGFLAMNCWQYGIEIQGALITETTHQIPWIHTERFYLLKFDKCWNLKLLPWNIPGWNKKKKDWELKLFIDVWILFQEAWNLAEINVNGYKLYSMHAYSVINKSIFKAGLERCIRLALNIKSMKLLLVSEYLNLNLFWIWNGLPLSY